jgi:ribosomal protein S24E
MGKLRFLVSEDMKLEIRERKKNPLMKREGVVIAIGHEGKATPDRKSLLNEVAKLLKARPEGIIIDRIITPGGRASSEARVLAYSRKDDVPAWRLKKMEQRLTKAQKKAEKKAAEGKPAGKGPEEKEEAPKEAEPVTEGGPAGEKKEG